MHGLDEIYIYILCGHMDPLVAAFATITSASADSERLMCWASSNSEASWGAGHEQCQNFLNPDAEDFLDRNTHQTNVQHHYTRNPNIISSATQNRAKQSEEEEEAEEE